MAARYRLIASQSQIEWVVATAGRRDLGEHHYPHPRRRREDAPARTGGRQRPLDGRGSAADPARCGRAQAGFPQSRRWHTTSATQRSGARHAGAAVGSEALPHPYSAPRRAVLEDYRRRQFHDTRLGESASGVSNRARVTVLVMNSGRVESFSTRTPPSRAPHTSTIATVGVASSPPAGASLRRCRTPPASRFASMRPGATPPAPTHRPSTGEAARALRWQEPEVPPSALGNT